MKIFNFEAFRKEVELALVEGLGFNSIDKVSDFMQIYNKCTDILHKELYNLANRPSNPEDY